MDLREKFAKRRFWAYNRNKLLKLDGVVKGDCFIFFLRYKNLSVQGLVFDKKGRKGSDLIVAGEERKIRGSDEDSGGNSVNCRGGDHIY